MANRVIKKPVKETQTKKSTKPNAFMRFFSKTKWAIGELIKVYSSKPSYFSKKRLESGVGFAIAEWGMIFWLVRKIDNMDTYDFAIWASIQFLVAGYMVKQIQRQKEFENTVEGHYSDSYDEPTDYDNDYDNHDGNDYSDDNNCECNCAENNNDSYDDYEENNDCDKPKKTRKPRGNRN